VVVSHQRPAVETGGGHVVASLLRQRASSAVLVATNVAWFGVAVVRVVVVVVVVVAQALAAAAPLGPRLVGWHVGCKDSPEPCLAAMARCVETGGGHVVASLLRQRASLAVLAATNVAWFGEAVVRVMVVVEALAAAAPLGPRLVG
jgi:hypothetical protein